MTDEEKTRGRVLVQLASVLQFTLPGIPCIYYGDEAGMEGYRDPFNRGTYPWGREDANLIDWYRTLGACRRDIPALAEGAYFPVPAEEDVACFVRRQGKSALLCAVNRGYGERRVALPPDFIGGSVCAGDGWVQGHELVLPPLGGAWVRL